MDDVIRLFLGGDLMIGRGVDQVLPHPGDPELVESWITDANDYVALAERVNGPVTRPIAFDALWGDALAAIELRRPAARIVNLETSLTRRGEPWPGKEVHYRANPANAPCLAAADLDVVALANNHVLDYGRDGLLDTLAAVRAAGVKPVGAGATLAEAREPGVVVVPGGRVLVYACGTTECGIPLDWAAGEDLPGVDLVSLTDTSADALCARAAEVRQPGDRVVVSIHWGSNWGWEVDPRHERFAHRLIDGGVDLVHGHSSHHPRPLEVYRGHLILYGCGELIDDYEGIGDPGSFRGDHVVLWFPELHTDGTLAALRLVPLRICGLRPVRLRQDGVRWVGSTLDRISRRFGARVHVEGAELAAAW